MEGLDLADVHIALGCLPMYRGFCFILAAGRAYIVQYEATGVGVHASGSSAQGPIDRPYINVGYVGCITADG